MNVFTSYETRRFTYKTDNESELELECMGWNQGGCNMVWSDVLPRVVALHGRQMLANANVLELGAGCGMIGLIASRFAPLVDISDGDPEEVALICENCLQHAQSPSVAQGVHLEWGAIKAREAVATGALRCKHYDVILASQVVYVPAAIPFLVETIATLLAPNGVAWLYNCTVSTSSTHAICKKILHDSLKQHGLYAKSGVHSSCVSPCSPTSASRDSPAMAMLTLPTGVSLPHEDAYLLKLTWYDEL